MLCSARCARKGSKTKKNAWVWYLYFLKVYNLRHLKKVEKKYSVFKILIFWLFNFVSSKFTYEANFPTLNICRKSIKAHNGLKLSSELCFGIMNATKDSYRVEHQTLPVRFFCDSYGVLQDIYLKFCIQTLLAYI